MVDGKTSNLITPSATKTGLKINGLNFTVEAASASAVIFDFDAAKSIVKTGSPKAPKYMLKPVLKVKIGKIQKDGKVKTEEKGSSGNI